MNDLFYLQSAKMMENLGNQKEKVDLNSFLLLTVVGKGSYAKVVLVRKKDTNKIYALKILKKDYIKLRKQVAHIKTERQILAEINHPFIVKLDFAFQNDKKLFFVLEYCPGGELFSLLQKKKSFNEDQIKFYVSQIIEAIEYLHSKDIIYRDLKPENVLIDKTGYIKITDFGLSKRGIVGNTGAYSICGTPEYLAPEILLKQGHGKAVDWWTLGSIIFEMLTGLPPFYTTNRDELFDRIKYETLVIPKKVNPVLRNLLEGLFQKNPNQRLGGSERGAQEIKSHKWFDGFDWEALRSRSIPPPFVPVLKTDIDVSYFDPEFTESAIYSFKDNKLMSSVDDQVYEGFSFSKSMSTYENKPEWSKEKGSLDNSPMTSQKGSPTNGPIPTIVENKDFEIGMEIE